MSYIQGLLEEFKNLKESLEDGEISKYEVANALIDISALIEAKKTNQQALEQEFKDTKSEVEQELVRDAIRGQKQEQFELEKLFFSFSESLANFGKKKNNIVHFRKK